MNMNRESCMNDKKVSIIIPVYNIEKYLSKCVDSLIAQEYPNYEIILLDDGSSDKSGEIMEFYASKYPYIRALHHTNHGVSYTRNRGIREVSGEYIAFIDGDDWVDKHYLSRMIEYLEENNLDFVTCNYSFYDDRKGNSNKWMMYEESSCVDKICAAEMLLTTSCVPWNKIYKKSVIKDCKFPEDIAIGEDTIFLMELLGNCDRIGFLNESLLFYRQREGSAMHSGLQPKIWDNVKSGNIVYDIVMSYSSSLRDAAEYRFSENMANILWKIIYSKNIKEIEIKYHEELKSLKESMRGRYRFGSKNKYILSRKRMYLNIAYISPFLLLNMFRIANFIKRR